MTSEAIGFSGSLLIALTASLHCVGMCGGFAVAAVPPRGAEPLPRRRAAGSLAASQALYHAGKLSSYLFLGAFAALLGAGFSRLGVWPERVLALVAGALLVSCGWQALGLLRGRGRLAGAPGSTVSPFGRAARAWAGLGTSLLGLDWPLRPLLLGAFSGLLPCPLVYAFVARSAASASPIEGIATMAALGVGTAPALSLVAAVGRHPAAHGWGAVARAWGAALIAMGIWTMLRGFSLAPCCV